MYQAELSIIVKAMREAYLAHGSFSRVNDKAPFDQVTDADVAIEAFLLQRIREHFPKDAILSEETLSHAGIQGRTWTVDPIDGTANFAKGFPLFGIQCALFEGGAPVMSAIWLPAFDECYTAVRGEGAYCNGERLTVLPCDPQRALVSFGDYPHSRPEDFAERVARADALYSSDKKSEIRTSRENDAVAQLLDELGEEKHHLLHVDYTKKD
jgi:myo-inositol-1(or 4)-monophosphatase